MNDGQLLFLSEALCYDIGQLKKIVSRNGYGLFDFQKCDISDEEFIGLMGYFGKPVIETDKHVQSHTSSQVVLHIEAQENLKKSVYLEPFSKNELKVHIERAFCYSNEQPNYVGLFCKEIGKLSSGNTIVLSMKYVFSQFTQEEKEILRQIYPYSKKLSLSSVQPIISKDVKRNLEYFSFRDLGELGGDWDYKFMNEKIKRSVAADTVNKLLVMIRDLRNFSKVPWVPGRLLIFDNKRFFHTRTANIEITVRYLKRIRVI